MNSIGERISQQPENVPRDGCVCFRFSELELRYKCMSKYSEWEAYEWSQLHMHTNEITLGQDATMNNR